MRPVQGKGCKGKCEADQRFKKVFPNFYADDYRYCKPCEKVIEKCNGQGCTVSEYLRELILKDLDAADPNEEIPKVRVTSIDDIPFVDGELKFEDE